MSRGDLIPGENIEFSLENYNPEHEAFISSLKIESSLVKKTARLYLPMQKKDARTWWENREFVRGRARLILDVRTMNVGLDEFWLEDRKTGNKARMIVIELSIVQPDIAKRIKGTAAALARRAGKGSGPYETAAKGFVSEYNRLISEAKSVLVRNPYIKALKPLSYGGNRNQSDGAVVTAATGLETYMSSFSPQKVLGKSAAALARRAGKGSGPYETAAEGFVSEYNRLISEARSVLVRDLYIKALKAAQLWWQQKSIGRCCCDRSNGS